MLGPRLLAVAGLVSCGENTCMRDAALAGAGPNAVDCGATNDGVDRAWRCATAAFEDGRAFAITEVGAAHEARMDTALASDGDAAVRMYSFNGDCPDGEFVTEPCVEVAVVTPDEYLLDGEFSILPSVASLRCVRESTY